MAKKRSKTAPDIPSTTYRTYAGKGWADQMNEGLIRATLEKQRESSDERIEAGEKMFDLETHW